MTTINYNQLTPEQAYKNYEGKYFCHYINTFSLYLNWERDGGTNYVE
jgi:hypothetical protein